MPRARTKLGTWGKITRNKLTADGEKPEKWEAITYYRDIDGRSRQVTATGPSGPKAESRLTEKLAKRYNATADRDELTPESLVEDLARAWLTMAKTKHPPSTYQRYRRATERHIVTRVGQLTIDELSIVRMERLFDDVSSEVGKPTAQIARVCLSAMWVLATKHGAARFGNLVKLTTPVSVDTKPVIALKPEEVKRVRKGLRADRLAKANGIADIVDFMLGTGARIGEVVVLKWRHVDLNAAIPTVLIESTAAWGDGRSIYAQPYPKGGPQARRRLKLPKWLVAVLRSCRQRTPHEPEDLVFPSRRRTIRHPNNVRPQIKDAHARAGLDELPMYPHVYRKTVGTRIGQKDPDKAASQLGHSNSAVTKRHYIEPTYEGPDARKELKGFGDLS
ncbi:tyrosine recombinase XerC [Nocardia sp. NPDC049149]|uniref:site-specific integrase n=1 Tax=Nocardia sp. NPDC049149 TaxID=3364315 RepID=UPI00371A2A85